MEKIFLDTTFVLPFFGIDLEIKGYTPKVFKNILSDFKSVHVSFLSIYEAKAKITRMYKNKKISYETMESFWPKLKILLESERFKFHIYDEQTDRNYNLISNTYPLDAFDTLILASAMDVGALLTEDTDMLSIRDKLRTRIQILNWQNLQSGA